jgi:hypothetical protein
MLCCSVRACVRAGQGVASFLKIQKVMRLLRLARVVKLMRGMKVRNSRLKGGREDGQPLSAQ